MSSFPDEEKLIENSINYICPKDKAHLVKHGESLVCSFCNHSYPIFKLIPILIDDQNSVFSTSDYVDNRAYAGPSYGSYSERSSGIRKSYRKFANWLSNQGVRLTTFSARESIKYIKQERPDAKVLVIGAGDSDFGQQNFIYTDVAFGRNVTCICDAHSLPFEDNCFDAVIVVAVLECVADPFHCVDEIKRVLKPGGFVYSEMPFMQPVHMGAYDFTRFTYIGHRRLFHWFDDIESGVCLGPATSGVFALQHFLLCLSDWRPYRKFARLVGLLVAVPLKQIDRLFRNRPGAYDAAAGVYFFGRKRNTKLSDKEIVCMYRGAQ